jgi:hypothetical protein
MHSRHIFFELKSIVLIREFMMDKYHRSAPNILPIATKSLLGTLLGTLNWLPNRLSRGLRNMSVNGKMATCLLLVALLGVPHGLAHAQRMDSFEGGRVRWELVDSDCQAQLAVHEISPILPHGGSSSEMFDVVCGQGTMALLAYPIEPCRILDEFRPALWVRSSSGRIQLGVRVIFPMAEHPVTLGRLNTILWGEIYNETGQWQMLQVEGLQKKLTLETVGLRQRFGSELNLDGAYIDTLVLNAYTGPGTCRVQVDDLNLRGLVSMAATGQPPPANWRERWRWRSDTLRTPEQRFWAGGNRPTTWLHFQQESLPWIKSLGFTGVILNTLPSQQQLTRVAEAELVAILPAPPHSIHFEPSSLTAIQGWSIGGALDARQAEVARSAAQRVAQLPSDMQRPLFGEALEQYWLFSRIADEVIVPFPAPATAGSARDKLAWTAQRLEVIRKRGAGWVSIPVGSTPAWVDQVRIAHELTDPQREFDELQANPLGLRYQTASAVLAGAGGFVFRPFSPLEPTGLSGAGGAAQMAAMRWIHADLGLWGPWIVGGQVAVAPSLDREDYVAGAWSVSHSQLVLALSASDNAHYCLPNTAERPLQISVASPATPSQVLRLTAGRLERMDATSTPAGLSWEVREPEPIETFLITANPLVIDFARNQLNQQVDQRAADQLEIVAYNLSVASEITGARFPTMDPSVRDAPGAEALARLGRAQRLVEQAYQALRGRQSLAAIGLAAQASAAVQAVLYESQQVATSNLAAAQSSPLVLNPASLSYHWRVADACARSQWRSLAIPGLELRGPAEMEALGWSLEQRPLQEVDMQVEFLPPTPEQPSGLRLAAYGTRPVSVGTVDSDQRALREEPSIPGGYEGASSRVRSAAVQVQRGELVRVAAKGRILQPPNSPDSGILVYDNQAGPSLGQLVRGAAGELVTIELYRFVVADGEFRILVECRGECDIVLEEISTSVIDPAVNRRSFITSSPE